MCLILEKYFTMRIAVANCAVVYRHSVCTQHDSTHAHSVLKAWGNTVSLIPLLSTDSCLPSLCRTSLLAVMKWVGQWSCDYQKAAWIGSCDYQEGVGVGSCDAAWESTSGWHHSQLESQTLVQRSSIVRVGPQTPTREGHY